jgi:hypothetical protein
MIRLLRPSVFFALSLFVSATTASSLLLYGSILWRN